MNETSLAKLYSTSNAASAPVVSEANFEPGGNLLCWQILATEFVRMMHSFDELLSRCDAKLDDRTGQGAISAARVRKTVENITASLRAMLFQLFYDSLGGDESNERDASATLNQALLSQTATKRPPSLPRLPSELKTTSRKP